MQVSHCSPKCDRRLAAATTPQNPFQSTCFLHLPQLWQEPIVLNHPLLTNEWNSLDFPAEDAVLVAHPNVQMFVLLFDCSTLSQEWNRQEIAFAHSDGSQDGQN